jgi:hypothetical protein
MGVCTPIRRSIDVRSWLVERLRRPPSAGLVCGAVSIAAGLLLFTRYSIDSTLTRDQAVYAYGGQQFAHGVPPYASIFDPKGPLSTIIAGLAASVARVVGVADLRMIRLVFFCCAVLTVLAVYALVAQLWRSAIAGVAAAVVFASFKGFAQTALGGPDAKTPGILFATVAMWLAVRRQWNWSAFVGSLALLVWQPLGIYSIVPVVGAALFSQQRRWRACALAAGAAAAPIAATVIYFAAEGALGKLVESGVIFPVSGIRRAKQTVLQRWHLIARVTLRYYGTAGALLLWAGLLLLLGLAIWTAVRARPDRLAVLQQPLIYAVLVTGLVEAAFASIDFQSYPDLYPLLPYGAIGLGGAVALLLRATARQTAMAVALVATASLFVFSVQSYTATAAATKHHRLAAQQAAARALARIVPAGTTLCALGDPVPLVLTDRRNPDRYIYLNSGVDRWKIEHTAGGFAGWTSDLRQARTSVIVLEHWHDAVKQRMAAWLKDAGGFAPGYLGRWRVYLGPAAQALARAAGIRITARPTRWPQLVRTSATLR